MWTIEYKSEDAAPWKTNGETYDTQSDAIDDAIDWLIDGYIVQVVEL